MPVGTLVFVFVAIKNKIVAVGVGVAVGVLVGEGINEGVKVGDAITAVCVCAACAVWAMMVSREPGPEAEGGGVTSTGAPQPKMTNPATSHKVIRRATRLFIIPPRYTLYMISARR
jgi:hypothetical protein